MIKWIKRCVLQDAEGKEPVDFGLRSAARPGPTYLNFVFYCINTLGLIFGIHENSVWARDCGLIRTKY